MEGGGGSIAKPSLVNLLPKDNLFKNIFDINIRKPGILLISLPIGSLFKLAIMT